MKKKKLFSVMISVILIVSLLTGCSANKNGKINGDNGASNALSSEKNSEITSMISEPAELTYLRSQIRENNASVGVAYIDFFINTENISTNTVAGDCSPSILFDKYPFLSKCKISLINGNVMFAIVPADKSSAVTVYKSGIDSNGNTKDERDNILFEGEAGAPVVLVCNDNESYSNVLISVKDGDKTVEFRPMQSLENGHDLVLTDGCYDFSVFDMRGYIDEANNYLCTNVKEISDGIKNGMHLNYVMDVFMYNHFALKFQLGTYNDEGIFDAKREFLIDEYYTMVFDQPDDEESGLITGWEVVCGGLDLEQLVEKVG